MNGIGCLLAAFVLVLYFQRLSLHHIPGREVVVTTFLPLGPCGQGGYALLQLVSILFLDCTMSHLTSDICDLLRAVYQGRSFRSFPLRIQKMSMA